MELASDVGRLSEVRADSDDPSASADRTLPGVNVKEVWRTVVIEHVVIVGVLLIVERDLHYRLPEHVRRRRKADHLC